MENLDAKTIYGIASLTQNWPDYREKFYHYACNTEDIRWQEQKFRDHMYNEYINVETPITLRVFNLDERNLKLLKEFIQSAF